MKDLKSSRMIWLKAILFLLIGLAAAGLLIAERPTLKVTLLLGLALWAFCRAYYFAFYVIEHYVDPGVLLFRVVVFRCLLCAKESARPQGLTQRLSGRARSKAQKDFSVIEEPNQSQAHGHNCQGHYHISPRAKGGSNGPADH